MGGSTEPCGESGSSSFVTGEPGIGKTTLVNAVLEQAASVKGVRMARGQCLEHYGAGEAYLPVLDAFSRLGRAPGGERIVELLRHHAPAWLLELPSLLPASERNVLGSKCRAPPANECCGRWQKPLRRCRPKASDSRPRRPALERLLDAGSGRVSGAARDPARLMVDRDLPARRRDPGRPSAEERQAGAAGTRPVSGAAARVLDRRGHRASTSRSSFPAIGSRGGWRS